MCDKSGMILSVCFMAGLFLCDYGRCSDFGDEAEFSYSDTAGNTDVVVFCAKNTMKYAFWENLEGVWEATGRYGKSAGERNVERYSTELRMNYLFAGKLYSSIITKWLTDEFTGIHWRYYTGPALGYSFMKGPVHFFSTEAGVNYTVVDYTDHSSEKSFEARIFAGYEYQVAEKARFKSSFEFFYNFEESDEFLVNSEISLVHALYEYLGIKTGFEIEYVNKPVPATLRKTDSVLSLSIVLTY